MARRWSGTVAVEGRMTGDGRVIAEGALEWGSLPLPFAWLQTQQHGDAMANPGGVDLGNVDSLERQDSLIVGAGTIDDSSEHGEEFVRKLDDGCAPLGDKWGVSIDVDDIVIEFVDTAPETDDDGDDGDDEVLVASASPLLTLHGAQARLAWASPQSAHSMWKALTAAAGDSVPEGAQVVDDYDPSRFVTRMTSGRVRGLTACQIAAFDEAFITLDAAASDDEDTEDDEALTASAFPARPPRVWFMDDDAPQDDDDPRLVPQYDVETGAYIGLAVPLTITSEGRVFGQLAPKNRCHSAHSVCITAPDSPSAYAHFHVGSTEFDDGTSEATGPLICGCDHAPLSSSMAGARDHYANTGQSWADVRVYTNKYGPWITGAVRPDVTDCMLRAMRGGGVSGDWRGRGADLELIAVQAVPVPGFTVQRVRPLAASATVWDAAAWKPEVSVAGELVAITTPPIQHAVTASATGCGCKPLAASAAQDEMLGLLSDIAARVDAVEGDLKSLLVRTEQFKQGAVDHAASAFARLRDRS